MTGPATPPRQGDLRLLESDIAKSLLSSTIPARCAYVASNGSPRIVATWFHWTGSELVMPTFISAPHVRHPAGRLRDLRRNPEMAISIDTESTPPQVLSIRGTATIHEVDGIVPEYAAAAPRYLGQDQASEYLAQIDQPITRMARIAVRPTWVGVLDFASRLPSALGGISS